MDVSVCLIIARSSTLSFAVWVGPRPGRINESRMFDIVEQTRIARSLGRLLARRMCAQTRMETNHMSSQSDTLNMTRN